MLVSGGAGPSMGLLDDIWEFSLLTAWHNESSVTPDDAFPEWFAAPATEPGWTRLDGGDGGSAGGLRPAPRRGHSCALLAPQRQLLLSGGSGAVHRR